MNMQVGCTCHGYKIKHFKSNKDFWTYLNQHKVVYHRVLDPEPEPQFIFRWHCGNCGYDAITTDDILVVPQLFQDHLRKNDFYCMGKEAFYVGRERVQ